MKNFFIATLFFLVTNIIHGSGEEQRQVVIVQQPTYGACGARELSTVVGGFQKIGTSQEQQNQEAIGDLTPPSSDSDEEANSRKSILKVERRVPCVSCQPDLDQANCLQGSRCKYLSYELEIRGCGKCGNGLQWATTACFASFFGILFGIGL